MNLNTLPHGGLTTKQQAEVLREVLPTIQGGTIVRFQFNGQTVCNLNTGALQPRGLKVLHQMVYWRFTQETAVKIAGWLNCKAVFSE